MKKPEYRQIVELCRAPDVGNAVATVDEREHLPLIGTDGDGGHVLGSSRRDGKNRGFRGNVLANAIEFGRTLGCYAHDFVDAQREGEVGLCLRLRLPIELAHVTSEQLESDVSDPLAISGYQFFSGYETK